MDLRGKEKDNSLVGLSIKYDYLVVDTCALISPIGKGNFHKNNLDEKIMRLITDFTSRGFVQQACSKYMELLAEGKIDQKIDKMYHPMVFLKVLAKSANIYKEVNGDSSPGDDSNNEDTTTN